MRGFQRYASSLIAELSRQKAVEVHIFSRTALNGRFGEMNATQHIWYGSSEIIWEQFEMPRRCKELDIQVLHCTDNRGIPFHSPCPTVITRHDEIETLFPNEVAWTPRSRFRAWYSDNVSMRRASKIVTVSECSRADILRRWSCRSADDVINCSEGIDESFFSTVDPAYIEEFRFRNNLPRRFFLYIGGFDTRKDVSTLIRAFIATGQNEFGLIIGGSRPESSLIGKELLENARANRMIKFLGYVPDADMLSLYKAASAFVYPSLYEGFGLQVIEAMAAGTPVIASDGGSLPEVCGGNAMHFRSGDIADCRTALLRFMEDHERSTESEGFRKYAGNFRWGRVIQKYLSVYEDLVY